MRPRLPGHTSLIQYLKRIDENRTYTNFGPLHSELEERLATYFGVRVDEVLLLVNGTLALQGAVAVASSSVEWVLPSWTFVASAEAVTGAGRAVRFCDVERSTWRMRFDPSTAHLPHMVVAPFGDSPRLEEIRRGIAGLPVISDAASCFDSCRNLGSLSLSNSAVMVSLHATKLVTTGEGGVLIGDSAWIADIKRWGNFGFRGRRIADVRGTNAKMSEYSAAVGLASLDEWSTNRARLASVAARYRRELLSIGISTQPSLEAGFVTSTLIGKFPDALSMRTARTALHRELIETRAWWSEGVHQMDSFVNCARREELLVTKELAETTLGLPFFVDMTDRQIDRVVEVIAGAKG